MTKKKQQILLKILLVFIILQPVLDILSRGAILEYIPNISKYIKPVFTFGLAGYLLLFYRPKKKKWFVYIILYMILTFGHTYLLYKLLVDNSVILHELRFLLNIAYMLALYISIDTLYYYYVKILKLILFLIYKSVFSHHRNYGIVLNDKVNHHLGLSPL